MRWLSDADLRAERREPLAIFGSVNGVRWCSGDVDPCILEGMGKAERCLAAQLDDHGCGLLCIDDCQHILGRERLEVEARRRVVVRRDGFGIAVDHDGLVASILEGKGCVHTAIVELDALPDPVRSGAKDHHGAVARCWYLAVILVGRVEVRCLRLELSGTGIDRLVGHGDPSVLAQLLDAGLGKRPDVTELAIGVSEPLPMTERRLGRAIDLERPPDLHDLEHLVEEPRVDAGYRVEVGDRDPSLERFTDFEYPFRTWNRACGKERLITERDQLCLCRVGVQSEPSGLERPQGLLERLGEGPSYGHRLTDTLHGRSQHRFDG